MTRIATPENEELLLHTAQYAPASQLETLCRKYAAMKRNAGKTVEEVDDRRSLDRRALDDGMHRITATLRPEEATLLWQAISKARQDLEGPASQRGLVDGLLALAQMYLRGEQPERPPVEIVVTVQQATLVAQSDDAGVTADGACVSAKTSQRLACDCSAVEVVEDADGNVLSVGRKSRTIPAAIRRAMLHRDEHRCRFPGCTAHVYVEGHHIEHWAKGGATDLANLVTLCSYHHAFVHDHGFRVALVDGAATFHDPRGRLVPDRPPPRVAPDAAVIREQHADLDISAETNRCRWGGERWDMDVTVSGLWRLEPDDDASSLAGANAVDDVGTASL